MNEWTVALSSQNEQHWNRMFISSWHTLKVIETKAHHENKNEKNCHMRRGLHWFCSTPRGTNFKSVRKLISKPLVIPCKSLWSPEVKWIVSREGDKRISLTEKPLCWGSAGWPVGLMECCPANRLRDTSEGAGSSEEGQKWHGSDGKKVKKYRWLTAKRLNEASVATNFLI